MSGPETAILAPMRYATLVVGRLRANAPFRADGGDLSLPWRQLRDRFAVEGVELNTRDVNAGREVAFELHLDAQRSVGHPLSYAYLHEDPLVRPVNGNLVELARYRKLFTSNEELVDHDHVIALDTPNDLTPREVPDFKERDLFCVLVAPNTALPRPHPRSLHDRRIDAIRFFEQHAPDRFALFGSGWDVAAAGSGVLGRLNRQVGRLQRRLRPDVPATYPSWRGPVERKQDVLDRARFAVCYEDWRGAPGYISEKIFDCLTSGCVPVYIGSAHSRPPIPEDCFIDGDQFGTPGEMFAFIERIDAGHFAMYQQGIREFLAGPHAQRFTTAHWIETLVTRILADVQQA